MSSCLNHLTDITNPYHLLKYAFIPGVSGAIGSFKVGWYMPSPNAQGRRFKPLTAAVYCAVSRLMTQLTFDLACRASHTVTPRDIVKVVGPSLGGLTIVAGAITAAIGLPILNHILSRDIAATVTGEPVDHRSGVLLDIVSHLLSF